MKNRIRIIYIIGTRPEIIRSASIIGALKKDSTVEFKLIHTGQHYDDSMNDVFFRELGVPLPDINLRVGSGSHAKQTADIMVGLEKVFIEFKPDIIGVFGDTNSSLAATLTAIKLKIPIAHLEAGCREWEMDIPEEVNRRLIDNCSNLLLAVSQNCVNNLKNEKVLGDIKNLGDPLFDVYKEMVSRPASDEVLKKLNLEKNNYVLLTLHRDKNVDNLENLEVIISSIASQEFPILFPVHPRTKKQLSLLKLSKKILSNFIFLDPLSYLEIISLLGKSRLLITDSGGLQKEALWSNIPCVTIREHTCWKETVDLKANYLVKVDKNSILNTLYYVNSNNKRIRTKIAKATNPYYKKNITLNTIKVMKSYAGRSWDK